MTDITSPEFVLTLRNITYPANHRTIRFSFSSCMDAEGNMRVFVLDVPVDDLKTIRNLLLDPGVP